MGEVTVTEAEAAAPPAVGVAVTVQAPATSGATYRPEPETDPQEALHVALALAVNCFESPSLRVALVGEMVMRRISHTGESHVLRAVAGGITEAESGSAGACRAGMEDDRRRAGTGRGKTGSAQLCC